jgi:hypothetical protein
MKKLVLLLALAGCGDDTPGGPYAYRDPSAGKIRLVRNTSASNADRIVLDLVTTERLHGWAVGFNLPLDSNRIALDPQAPMIAGRAWSDNVGKVVIPQDGPLSGVLVAAQSARSGDDVDIPAGTVLLSVRLGQRAGGTSGTVFDGAPQGFRAGLLDKRGNVVVAASDFAIGRLDLR